MTNQELRLWLSEKLSDEKHNLTSRLAAEKVWRDMTDDDLRRAAAKYVPPYEREANAAKESRIAEKCRRDIAAIERLIELVEKTNANPLPTLAESMSVESITVRDRGS